MNPEAQRIAIAEACGYIGPFDTSEEWHDEGEGAFQSVILRDSRCCQVPDYLSDLNAMHEAEKVLKGATQHQYVDWLQRCAPADGRTAFKTLRATAAQRAEAFLKTIGKWEGER